MTDREKLLKLLCHACAGECASPYCFRVTYATDYLLNHGVTFKPAPECGTKIEEEQ